MWVFMSLLIEDDQLLHESHLKTIFGFIFISELDKLFVQELIHKYFLLSWTSYSI